MFSGLKAKMERAKNDFSSGAKSDQSWDYFVEQSALTLNNVIGSGAQRFFRSKKRKPFHEKNFYPHAWFDVGCRFRL